MFLVLANTNQQSSGWPLTEAPLTVGRGDGADVRLFDPTMSRRHLRIWIEKGAVNFQDLGASNAVLVNGRPLHGGQLQVGDTLSVGSTLFRIERTRPTRPVSSPDDTPITASVARSVYSDVPLEVTLQKATPRTVQELYDLFQLGRGLATMESVQELLNFLYEFLQSNFQPKSAWIALQYPDSDTLFFHTAPEQVPPSDEIQSILRSATRNREGLVKPSIRKRSDGGTPRTLLAAPFIHLDHTIGGFVLCGEAPGRTYTEADLHFALGIAAMTAPHLRAVQHFEQIERDNRFLMAGSGQSLELVGESPPMRRLRTEIRQAAHMELSVLVQGETGTGKEIVARLLHEWGPRRSAPFVVINCAAIPKELFESELFGHEKGAFTGATQRRIGRMEEAHGGTLFLDEIGDLSQDNQARMLRAVETGVFRRVGGSEDITVNVRIVAATNKALKEPEFRSDLRFRLSGLQLRTVPLREIPQDIPRLAAHFLLATQLHGVEACTPEALEFLARMPWPGNNRELRTAIHRAAAFARQPRLSNEDFRFLCPDDQKSDGRGVQFLGNLSSHTLLPLAEIERAHIQHVLQACEGNLSQAARVLGIARATLYKKLEAR